MRRWKVGKAFLSPAWRLILLILGEEAVEEVGFEFGFGFGGGALVFFFDVDWCRGERWIGVM